MSVVGTSRVDLYLCGNTTLGTARGSICAYASASIGVGGSSIGGWVGASVKGRSKSTSSLVLKGSASGYSKRQVKGMANSSSGLLIKAKAIGSVRSIVNIKAVSGSFSPPRAELSTRARVLSPLYTTKDLSILVSHWGSFIPEVAMPVLNDTTKSNFDRQKKISVAVLKEYVTSDEFRGDRRNWLVAQVLYEGYPVMYILNVGWQGITYPMRYLVDHSRYSYMIHYLFNMVKADEGGEGPLSLSGLMNDRIRVVQPEYTDINNLPKAIKQLIHEFGDLGE